MIQSQRRDRARVSHHIIEPALIACGWLMVMGMLRVCRLLNAETALAADVGVMPLLTTEFSEAVT